MWVVDLQGQHRLHVCCFAVRSQCHGPSKMPGTSNKAQLVMHVPEHHKACCAQLCPPLVVVQVQCLKSADIESQVHPSLFARPGSANACTPHLLNPQK